MKTEKSLVVIPTTSTVLVQILLHIEEPGGSSESSGLGGDVMRSDFTPFLPRSAHPLPARVSLVTATASPAFWLRWSCRPP